MSFKEIYNFLKENGFETYSIGQHKGLCKTPYLVIRNNGEYYLYSNKITEYEILIYMPYQQYSQFEDYIKQVTSKMNKLFPLIKLKSGASEHYLDEDVQGYMASVIYQSKSKNEVNKI